MQFGGFSATAGTATVTPPNTPGLLTWHDFSDVASLTTSGTFVTGASDKSTNGFNATNTETASLNQVPAFAAAVQNNLGALYLPKSTFTDGSHTPRLTVTAALLPTGDQAFSYVGVGRVLNTNTAFSIANLFEVVNADNSVAPKFSLLTTDSADSAAWYNAVSGGVTTNTGFSPYQWRIYSARGTTGTQTSRVDGGAFGVSGTGGTSTATRSSSGTLMTIGNERMTGGGGSLNHCYAFDGYIGEVRTFNTYLGTDDLYKEEGYLAWKWGLQGNLPGTHPYKNAPP
jgi:hypothetical protein